jgi:parallel beta-helix repeat protein
MLNDYCYPSSMMLTDCTFTGNTATSGGGMYNDYFSDPTLITCTFENNTASSRGGGINCVQASNPTLTECIFTGNTATDGGGISNDNSSPMLTDCTFTGNTATDGGGMYNAYNSNPELTDCTFEGNMTSTVGGAIRISSDSTVLVTNSVFTGNSSMSLDITTNFGGAIYNDGLADFTNCEFKDNSSGYGGAFHTTSTGTTSLTNCAVKRNIGKVCGGASFNLLGSITSQNTLYCGNLPDHLVGGWVDDGGNELLDTCIPDEPGFCASDVNQDYDVDILDLLYVIAVWGTDNPAGDINEDGWVDVADILVLISEWGACP